MHQAHTHTDTNTSPRFPPLFPPCAQGLEEQRRQFKQVEQQCVQRKARLLVKQPEIQKALDIVTLLREREQQGDAAPVAMDYELAESVYAKARVGGVKTVNLWLGAGVMAEYPLQEAKVGDP